MSRFLNNTWKLLAISGLFLLNSCGPDGEPLSQSEPFENNGTVNIELIPNTRNYSVAPDQKVIISLRVTKAANGNRPQKLRLYTTSTVGTKENEAFQVLDLKNRDEQVKTIEYTATGSGIRYLYFEVDESGGRFKTDYVTVNVGGTATIAEWNNVTLGAQADPAPSRFASASGVTYLACDLGNEQLSAGVTAEGNLKYVDIVYRTLPRETPTAGTLMSNPQSAQEGFSTTAKCDGNDISTAGGRPAYFAAAPNGINFATADAAALNGLAVSSSSPQKISVTAGGVYAFLNSDGKKGLIRVDALPSVPGNGTGTVTISVKVLR